MTESQIQQNIITYLSLIASQYKFVFFSVPNEGIMSILIAFKVPKVTCFKIISHFKKMGLLPGTSDIVIVHKGLAYCLEVKTDTGTQSKNQILFMRNILSAGGKYEIVHSVKDVQLVLEMWGIM